MAVPEGSRRFQNLRLDTRMNGPVDVHPCEQSIKNEASWTTDHHEYIGGDSLKQRRSETVDEYSATPPIPITIPNGRTVHHDSSSEIASLVSGPPQSKSPFPHGFLRNRGSSVTFDTILKLDSGECRQMQRPSEKPSSFRHRSSSPLHTMAADTDGQDRSRSKSNHPRDDPNSVETPPSLVMETQNGLCMGQSRQPLLRESVNEAARGSWTDSPEPMPYNATQSVPIKAGRTTSDQPNDFPSSLGPLSPDLRSYFFDERAPSKRYVDRSQTAAAGFFSRTGSFGKSPVASSARQGRRSVSSSAKSPKSAASSFLGSFSAGRRSCKLAGHEGLDGFSADAEGQTVGDDYVLGKQIGFGGFSVVKEAYCMNPDGSQRKIAVKIVRRNIQGKSEVENEQAQAEFDHEVELWRFLKHPCILPLEAVYKTEDATFCFIPLNIGGTLFDAVRANRTGLPMHLAKHYSYQLATAIRFLHDDARVAHRDIKLENCLLDASVQPARLRLCDFGMAEWITCDSDSRFDQPPSPTIDSADRPPQRAIGPSDTSTSAFAGGSLEYAAPEIVQLSQEMSTAGLGQGCATREAGRGIVSPSGDMWAFGVCVYALIVGSRPFQGSFSPRVATAIVSGDWDQARLKDKGGDEPLELVRGCLEVNAQDRWDASDVLSCAWMREEVEQGGDEQAGGGMNAFGSRNIWGIQ